MLPPITPPKQVVESELVDYTDVDQIRRSIMDRTIQATQSAFPINNVRHELSIAGLKYTGPDRYSLSDQKKAILNGQTLSRRLVGKWQLKDVGTGKLLSESAPRTVLNVPYLTDRGTFIRRGTEYTFASQFRLTPSVYTRTTDDGMVESQFNAVPGSGPSFRVFMDPKSSIFYMRYGTRKIPLFPVLSAAGYDMEALERRWGKAIFDVNKTQARAPHALNWIKQYEVPPEPQVKTAALAPPVPIGLRAQFERTRLDPDAVRSTLGTAHDRATPEVIAEATSRILSVSRAEADTDDRDSLEYQKIYDFSDYLPERIIQDQHAVARKLLWQASYKANIDKIPPAALDRHLQHLFNNTGLAQAVEEINPLDMFDQNQRVTRLGEGAMSSIDIVPKDARNVQPSYANFVDTVRAPESLKIGVDMRLARNVRKGPGNQLFTKFTNARTGNPEWVSATKAARSVVLSPEFAKTTDEFVPAMVRAKGIEYVPRAQVDYIIPNGDDMFSEGSNLVPLKSGVKAMRVLMGAKFGPQALPLVQREAPLVQTETEPGGQSIEQALGKKMGAVEALGDGVVKAVYKDHIIVSKPGGGEYRQDLYDNFPFARKTFIRNTALVKAGQPVLKGHVLATSNFTDGKGVTALGTNLRVGYLNYDGKTFEDAVVISESAARGKLTSEHMYNQRYEPDKTTTVGLEPYLNLYPGKYSKAQLGTISSDGVVKAGTVLRYGDPVVLASKERPATPGSMGRRLRSDDTQVWEHHFPGAVTDVTHGRKGIQVSIRSNVPTQVGDKLSNRFGGKGVISAILPDSDMPTDEQGDPLEILMSPLTVGSRTNPAQKAETVLGKVARKTGKPFILPGFTVDPEDSIYENALAEAKKARVKSRETLVDPKTGRSIPGILTGSTYIYKLQHTAEGKSKSRSTAGYTSDEQPARGGKSGAKHIGDMESQAILAHGAGKVLKDMRLIKGQRNDDFWRQLKLGQTPVMPGTPMVYNKFNDYLRAAGIDLRHEKDSDNVYAMTDKRAKELTGSRRIRTSDTYGAKNMEPLVGGLFDPDATGSMRDGDRWAYIDLPTPLPNPVMEEPLRIILGKSQKEFDAMVMGQGAARNELRNSLNRIDVRQEKESAMNVIRHGPKTHRDAAVRRFGYLDAMDQQGVHPKDFLMTRVPVLPPRFRPITRFNDMTLVADPNYLYKALMNTSADYQEAVDNELPPEAVQEALETMHKTYRALVGISDPVQQKLQQKKVGGILQQVFGKGSPKTGFVQRRVLGTNIDVAGYSVVTPNPALKLNEVGLPVELAWNLYEPATIRHMVRHGVPAAQAAKEVANHSKSAMAAMQAVVKERPVLVNRAPTLHKYSVMAFWPVLSKGHTLQVPPQIVGPFAMDFDGDTASYSVPVSDEAVEEAKRLMLPSKNLFSSRFPGQAMYVPTNEYMQGLNLATRPAKAKPTTTFRTKADAVKAYRRGSIAIDDPIEILEK